MTALHALPNVCPVRALLVLAVIGASITAPSAAEHRVSSTTPLVIPIAEVIGGTGVENNAKSNPQGGYFSVFASIREFRYPATHGNQLGATALVNDHIYWDSSPGGLDHTHAPHPDAGGGKALWWPIPGEWVSYAFTVTDPAAYSVVYRFSSSWGPAEPVVIEMTVDGVSSGPITMKPDDARLWTDKRYLSGGWWGHTMVSGTTPVGWKLAAGSHVLKVQMVSFPAKAKDHGNVWLRYFKIQRNVGGRELEAKAAEPKQLEPKPAEPKPAETTPTKAKAP